MELRAIAREASVAAKKKSLPPFMKGEMKPHGKKHEGKESKPFEKKERKTKGYSSKRERY